MSRAKVALLSLIAACALSALALSTTSAAGTHQWILNGTPLAGTEEIQGNNLPQQQSQIEVTLFKMNIHWFCQASLTRAGSTLEGGSVGKVKTKIEFKGCSIYHVTKAGVIESLPECKFKEPLEVEVEGELAAVGELILKPKEKVFFEFTVEKINKEAICSVEGKGTIEGGVLICPIPHFGINVYIGTLSCTPGGSTVTFGKELMKFYLQILIALEKGGKWRST